MAQQSDFHGRMTGGICRQGRRGCRPHLPPGLDSAWCWRCADAKNEGRDAGLLGRKRQPPARRQVQVGAISPGFDHDRAKLVAADDVVRRLEQGGNIVGQGEDDPSRIHAKVRQARPIDSPGHALCRLVPDPQYGRALRAGSHDKHQDKARGDARIGGFGRENLMKPGAMQSAAQMPVQRLAPKAE